MDQLKDYNGQGRVTPEVRNGSNSDRCDECNEIIIDSSLTEYCRECNQK